MNIITTLSVQKKNNQHKLTIPTILAVIKGWKDKDRFKWVIEDDGRVLIEKVE